MIVDRLTQFCSAESVAASAGTALVGDVIDLGLAGRNLAGGGKSRLWLVIGCTTSIITGGAAGTIQFILASDAQAAIATDGSATEHWRSETYVTDGDDANALDAGARIAVVPLPGEADNSVYERYLGVLVVTATTTTTAGAIDAFLTHDPAQWKSYADADN